MKNRIKPYLPVLLLFIIAVAFFAYFMGSEKADLGIVSGTITYGPTYPGPCREGMDCSDKPYSGVVYVKSPDKSKIINEFNTSVNGTFSFEINPGTYFLEVGQRFMSVCGKDFAVEANKVTALNISCDTGMR